MHFNTGMQFHEGGDCSVWHALPLLVQLSLFAENFHEMLEWDFGSKILEFLLAKTEWDQKERALRRAKRKAEEEEQERERKRRKLEEEEEELKKVCAGLRLVQTLGRAQDCRELRGLWYRGHTPPATLLKEHHLQIMPLRLFTWLLLMAWASRYMHPARK